MAAKIVGLDIGTSGIRAVQLERHRKSGEYTISRAAAIDLPQGAFRNGEIVDAALVVKTLRKLWRQGRFSSRKVVLGLADSGVLTRQLDLPWMPSDDFRAALRYQVTDAIPVDLSTVEIDYHVLAEVQRTDDRDQVIDMDRILVVATSSEAVTTEATIIRKARLEPVGADTAAFALIRAACQGQVTSTGEVHAIADLGAGQLTVVIHQDGQPRLIRTITNVGGDTATDALAERLRIEPEDAEILKRQTGLNGPAPDIAPIAESSVFGGIDPASRAALDPQAAATVEVLSPWANALIGELRNSLDYFQASAPSATITSLTLAGRTAELGGLVDRIATEIPLPVRVIDPFAGLQASRRVRKHHDADARLVIAAGLAMGVR
jgi:type IV pilus assembly protein PilM